MNASCHKKCVSLSNQKCKIQPTLIKLCPNKNLRYYPFVVKLDKSVGNCNTLNDFSNKVYVPSKTKDLNIHVLNMITEKDS